MIDLKTAVKKHMLKVILVIAFFVVFFVLLENLSDWLFLQGPDVIKNFFDSFGYAGPLLFILIYIVVNVFLTPSYPFIFVGGMVYGIWGGIVLSLIGAMLSATLNFYIGRKVKRKFFVHRIRNDKIRFAKKYIEKHGFGVILMLRYLGFYFNVVSYAAGMTKIKFKDFITASFIGFIPYILIYVYAGHHLMEVKSSSFVFFILIFKLVIFGLFILGYAIYKKAIKKNYFSKTVGSA